METAELQPASQPSAGSASGIVAPGPQCNPVLGMIPGIAVAGGPLEYFLEAARKYGPVVRLSEPFGRSSYLVTGPAEVKEVFQTGYRNYDKTKGLEDLKVLLGSGLPMREEGPSWLKQRKLMQPVFHMNRMRSLVSHASEASATLVESWKPAASSGATLDLCHEMDQLSLRTVSLALFGADLRGTGDELTRIWSKAIRFAVRQTGVLIRIPAWVPTPGRLRFNYLRRKLRHRMEELLASRKASREHFDDLMAVLMAARDEDTDQGMTDQELRDEVLGVLIGGYHTVSAALSWGWHILSTHPEFEERIHQEARSVLGDRAPGFEDIQNLAFTRMFFQEILRCFPPAWMLPRVPRMDVTVGGYRIPRGATVYVCPYVTHRLPHLWEDPDRFDPERFTEEKSQGRHPCAYYPFGFGPRQCIGQNFAIMESVIMLASIVRSYKIRAAPGMKVRPFYKGVLSPCRPFKVRLEMR